MAELAQLLKIAIALSVVLVVFSLGLEATFPEAISLLRDTFKPPYRLLRATFAMNVVVPAIAIAAVEIFDLPQAVSIAILAMAISPVPPVLPGKQMKFGARPSYVLGLLVAASLTSILLAPLTVEIIGRIFHRDLQVTRADIAWLVGKTVLIPLGAGLLVSYFAPRLAAKMAPAISKFAFLFLILGLAPVLYATWPQIMSLFGNGTVLIVAGVVVAAIAAGQLIGARHPGNRTALAITCAMRHPGIALTIGTTNFPENKLLPAAVALYILIATILTTVYGKIRQKQTSAAAADGA
jgi:bile acid:Na+ symporter, BASS family